MTDGVGYKVPQGPVSAIHAPLERDLPHESLLLTLDGLMLRIPLYMPDRITDRYGSNPCRGKGHPSTLCNNLRRALKAATRCILLDCSSLSSPLALDRSTTSGDVGQVGECHATVCVCWR